MNSSIAKQSSKSSWRVLLQEKAAPQSPRRWYSGITRYQWLVLILASLGWIFDIYEAQVFVASMN